MHRRSFFGMLAAMVALFPVFPIRNRRITIKLLPDPDVVLRNDMAKKHGVKVPYMPDLPHANSRYEAYGVYEGGVYAGTMKIYYNKIGITEIRDRKCTDVVTFETFFDLTVTCKDHIRFRGGTYNMERKAQDKKEVLPIARKMLTMAVDKMEQMIQKYQKYKDTISGVKL